METLTANIGAGVRRETLDGRAYLVAPLSLIVPGVLPGSQGPLYYPPDEVGENPRVWDGVPLTNGHPADDQGQPLSASSPGVVQKVGLGKVRKGKYTANGKLTAEGWFDELLVKDRAPVLYHNLLSGRPTELSTGLYTTNEPAPRGYVDHLGRPYSGMIARRYRPDHVAILESQPGACSIRDGCGVLNAATDLTAAVRAAADKLNAAKGRMPGYGQTFLKGTEVWYVGGDGDEDSFVRGVEPAFKAAGATKVYHESEGFPPKDGGWTQINPKHTVNKAPPSPQENRMGALERLWAATLNALLGNAEPDHDEDGEFKAKDAADKPTPKGKKGAKPAKAEDSVEAGSAAAARKVSAIDPPTKNAAPDQPRCPRTGVYQPPGYHGEGKGETHAAAKEGHSSTGFDEVTHVPPPPPTAEETAVDEKLKVVNTLTANCGCWKGKADLLNNLTVEDLKELAEQHEIVKNLKADPEKYKLAVNATTMCKGGKEPDGDEKGLPAGKMLADNEGDPAPAGGNQGPPQSRVPPIHKDINPDAPTGNKAPTPERKPMTSEEWLAAAPPEVRERDAFAQQILNQHKLGVVQRLVANVADPEKRKLLGNRYLGKTLPELEEMLELLPSPVANRQQYVDPGQYQAPALYVGANAPYTANAAGDPDDVLDIPTMNYGQTA